MCINYQINTTKIYMTTQTLAATLRKQITTALSQTNNSNYESTRHSPENDSPENKTELGSKRSQGNNSQTEQLSQLS